MSDFTQRTPHQPVPYRIIGNDIQAVEFDMEPGDRVVAQPRSFVCAAGGVRDIGLDWGKRLRDPLVRKMSGESPLLQDIACRDGRGRLVLSAPQFGKIIPIPMDGTQDLICQKGAFIAATGEIDISIAFTRRIRAGLFGGQGMVFQRASGVGTVFLHAFGHVVDWQIAPGRLIRVSTNNILAFESSVGYDIQAIGGLLATLFAGEGMFMAQLEGPGRVLVQSVDHEAFRKVVGMKTTKGPAKSKAGPPDA